MFFKDDDFSGTRKIAEPPRPCLDPLKPCLDPQHDPASHCVFEPGLYEHICPSCGRRMTFSVPLILS